MLRIPDQLIPESKKNKEWCRSTAHVLARYASSFYDHHSFGKKAYDTYYGLQEAKDYEYLTGEGEYRMPASVRWMHVSRPYFDILLSTAQARPFEPSVYAVDDDSIDAAKERKAQQVIETVFSSVHARQKAISAIQQQAESVRQEMQAQAERAGGMDPSASIRFGMIEQDIRRMEAEAARGMADIDREINILEKRSSRTVQANYEIELSRGLEYLFHKNGLKEIFLKGFESSIVLDQEIYTIDDVMEGHDPKLRWVNPMSVSYGISASSAYIDEAPWVVEDRFIPFHQVMTEFGAWLGQEDIQKLEGRMFSSGSEWSWYHSGLLESSVVGAAGCYTSTGYFTGPHTGSGDSVRVRRVCWQSPRKIRARRSKSKDEEISFTHLIADDERPGKNDEVLERWVNDWWETTIIGDAIYVKEGKCAFQHRDIREIGKAYGPYIGHAYNNMDRRPYSRVMAVQDVNILYNLVVYQIELTIALSGMRGFVMDKAQIPAGMSFKEWLYNLKQGIAVIDSSPAGNARRMEQRYNQFSTFDMTFADTIQHLYAVLDRLEYMIGRILGIPQQRLGELAASDQVGTTASAINQSNLTTEVMFNKHEYLKKRVLDRLVNTLPLAWKKGRRGRFVAGDFGQKMFQIASDDLSGKSFEVFFRQGGKEQKVMDIAGQLIGNEYGKGAISFSQLLSLYNMTNLRELQESVEHFENLAIQKAEGQMQQEAANEQQRQREAQEYQMMAKRMATDGERMKNELERFRIEMDSNLRQSEINARAGSEAEKSAIAKDVAKENTNVELAYLAEQRRATDIDARLKLLEIAVKGGGSGSSVSSPSSKNDISDR